jgi:hypothetical protein
MKRMYLTNRRGAFTVEAAVAWTAIIGGLVFMLIYLQRGVQGGMKSNADSMGQQYSTQTGFNSFSSQKSITSMGNGNSYTETTSCSNYQHVLDENGNAAMPNATNCAPTTPSGYNMN